MVAILALAQLFSSTGLPNVFVDVVASSQTPAQGFSKPDSTNPGADSFKYPESDLRWE